MPAPWRWICCKRCCSESNPWTKPWRLMPASVGWIPATGALPGCWRRPACAGWARSTRPSPRCWPRLCRPRPARSPMRCGWGPASFFSSGPRPMPLSARPSSWSPGWGRWPATRAWPMPCCGGSTARGRRPILGKMCRPGWGRPGFRPMASRPPGPSPPPIWWRPRWISRSRPMRSLGQKSWGPRSCRPAACACGIPPAPSRPCPASPRAAGGCRMPPLHCRRSSCAAPWAKPSFPPMSSTSAPPPAARRPSWPRRASPSPPSTVRPSACGG